MKHKGKHLHVLQSLIQFWQTHISTKFLKHNLHKDSTGGRRCVFTHFNAFKDLRERNKTTMFHYIWKPICCLKCNYSLRDAFVY